MTALDRARLAREAEALGRFRAAAILRAGEVVTPEPSDRALMLEAEARELEALGRWAEAMQLRMGRLPPP